MGKSLLELLTEVTVIELVVALILIVTIVSILASQKKRILKWMNKWRKNKNEEEDFNQLVYDLKDSVAELKKTMGQFQKNREHDREDSRKIRSEMYKVMDKQSAGIRNLTDIIVEMQKKNSKTKRAEIKEKIERIYRECHPSMTCTDMAFETLRELIEEYEAHGGINSFVHSTVEPEMYEWKVIKSIK
jgi:chromosome segregation ATPase